MTEEKLNVLKQFYGIDTPEELAEIAVSIACQPESSILKGAVGEYRFQNKFQDYAKISGYVANQRYDFQGEKTVEIRTLRKGGKFDVGLRDKRVKKAHKEILPSGWTFVNKLRHKILHLCDFFVILQLENGVWRICARIPFAAIPNETITNRWGKMKDAYKGLTPEDRRHIEENYLRGGNLDIKDFADYFVNEPL